MCCTSHAESSSVTLSQAGGSVYNPFTIVYKYGNPSNNITASTGLEATPGNTIFKPLRIPADSETTSSKVLPTVGAGGGGAGGRVYASKSRPHAAAVTTRTYFGNAEVRIFNRPIVEVN